MTMVSMRLMRGPQIQSPSAGPANTNTHTRALSLSCRTRSLVRSSRRCRRSVPALPWPLSGRRRQRRAPGSWATPAASGSPSPPAATSPSRPRGPGSPASSPLPTSTAVWRVTMVLTRWRWRRTRRTCGGSCRRSW